MNTPENYNWHTFNQKYRLDHCLQTDDISWEQQHFYTVLHEKIMHWGQKTLQKLIISLYAELILNL